MAIAAYKACKGKNVPGNDPLLFLVETDKITSVTETSDQISAVTMETIETVDQKFKQVLADFDSVQYTSEGTFKTSGGETESLIARFSYPSTEMQLLKNEIKAAVACGVAAIFVDANRNAWCMGISAASKEGKSRPINQVVFAEDSGVLMTDEDMQQVTMTFSRLSGWGRVEFDDTLTSAIAGGTATFIDWD